MGNYKDDRQNTILSKGMIEDWFKNKATYKTARDHFLMAVLYLTGARPYEVTQLKRGDVWWDESWVYFKVYNAKLGKVRHFKVRERTLVLARDSAFMDLVLSYLQTTAFEDQQRLFPITTSWIRELVKRMTKDTVCPYTFRHSRMANLSRDGAELGELMSFKGAVLTSSVSPYLANKPTTPRKVD